MTLQTQGFGGCALAAKVGILLPDICLGQDLIPSLEFSCMSPLLWQVRGLNTVKHKISFLIYCEGSLHLISLSKSLDKSIIGVDWFLQSSFWRVFCLFRAFQVFF